jgi:hypothetical protein
MNRPWQLSFAALVAVSAMWAPTAAAATQFTEQAKLTASDGADSGFGASVAISGDTIVVGAPSKQVGANHGQGAVYVFKRAASGWGSGAEIAKLTASDGVANDRFGTSVAISGDTIVVGCPCPRGNAMQPLPGGAVYVFTKPAGGWATGTETAKLLASERVAGGGFGVSVAISGDAIVAAGQQSAYVFIKPAGGWVSGAETAKLTASDAAVGFGSVVAISADTIVAGAPFDKLTPGFMCPCNQGSAYVYTEPAGGWATATETAKLVASDATGDGFFGRSVAVSGDTIVAGAVPMIGLSAGAGSAYVFIEPSGGWVSGTETAKLTASDGALGDALGLAVAVSGDTIVAGAPFDDGSIADQGSAYTFTEPAAGWVNATESTKLNTSDTEARGFGRSVAVGGETIVVSAGNNLGPGRPDGAAYVFEAETDTLAPTTTITVAPAAPDGEAGWYVSPTNVTVSAIDEAEGSGVAETRCVLDPSVAPTTFADLPAGPCAYLGSGAAVTTDGSHSLYAASIDVAGNAEAPVLAQFMIDQTPPEVTCAASAPFFLLNEAGGTVNASVGDSGSGPSVASVSAATDTSSVGDKSALLMGSDVAGNASTVACPYTVTFVFEGFFDPVANDGVLNIVRAGQAIPLKWRILDANGAPVTDLAAVTLSVESLTCSAGMTGDELTETAAGGSGLQNLGDGYYQINWLSLRRYADSCKTLRVDLGEGIFRTALFQFIN